MTNSPNSTLPQRIKRLLFSPPFERWLAIAVLLGAGLTYFFLPVSLYRLIGVFNTELIARALAIPATLLGFLWVFLYLRRYLVRNLKRVLLAILIQITFAGSGVILLLYLPFIIEFLLLAVGSIVILAVVAVLVILWLLPGKRQGHRGRYLLSTVTLLVALSVPLYFALRLVVEPRFIVGEDLHFADHHYYLASELRSTEGSGESFLVLFECNQWAFNCGDVYETEMIGYDEIGDFTLTVEEVDGLVSVYNGSRQLTSYKPGSGEALGQVFSGIE